jgi:hypothetical protein
MCFKRTATFGIQIGQTMTHNRGEEEEEEEDERKIRRNKVIP